MEPLSPKKKPPHPDEQENPESKIALPSGIMLRRLEFPQLSEVLGDLAGIDNFSNPLPWGVTGFADFLKAAENFTIGAFHGGDLVGYLLCQRGGDEISIVNIATAPRWRRHGIAQALIAAVVGRNPGATLFLEVRSSNKAAIELYKKCGFVKVGIREKFYHDNGEDAFTMKRAVKT